MQKRSARAPFVVLCCAGAALAQDLAIYDHAQACDSWDLSTMPALAVGNQIVVAGSHRMMLYNKFPIITPSTTPLASIVQTDTAFPFKHTEPASFPFVNLLTWPDAAFDPYTGRTWIAFGEANGILPLVPPCYPAQPDRTSTDCFPNLHLAASKSATVSGFGGSDWNFITGSSATSMGNGGAAFFVGIRGSNFVQPFRATGHLPVEGFLTWLSLAFDENDVFVAGNDLAN